MFDRLSVRKSSLASRYVYQEIMSSDLLLSLDVVINYKHSRPIPYFCQYICRLQKEFGKHIKVKPVCVVKYEAGNPKEPR